jgi:glycosyltransferase involved in cell wall biosynthesis
MRVLIISQYFPPETGGAANRLHSFARSLKEEGHDVVVVTEKPNYPEGIIQEEYRDGWFDHREYDGISAIHAWVYTRPEKTFMTRMLFFLSFMVMAVIGARRAKGDFDVVLASSPPLFVGVSGWLVAQIKKAKFVFDVRDIWPEVAVAMGALTNPQAIQLAEALEHFIYRKADAITAATDSFCGHIQEAIVAPVPTRRVMNGTVPEVFQQDMRRKSVRQQCDADDKFVVTYAGNVGLAQGLHHVLGAAERLQENDRVVFHIVGNGSAKDELVAEAETRGLTNVRFLPRVPLEEAAAHMAASDALLVPLEDHEIYQQFIPSKLFDSMASGRPVLLAVDGEARSILEDAGSGLYYPAEDGTALAKRIRWLLHHPDERQAMGRRGREYATRHCTRAAQGRVLVDFLEDLVGAQKQVA